MEKNYYLARKMLIRHEDKRAGLYCDKCGKWHHPRCPDGKYTIGIGRNIEDKPLKEKEIQFLFMCDLDDAISDCKAVFGDDWNNFPERKQCCFIDMMFNLGRKRFSGFKDMIAAARRQDWLEVAEEAKDSDWYSQVKSRGKEIYEILKE
jgi:lysozyme